MHLFLSPTNWGPVTCVLLENRVSLFVNARWLVQGLAGAHYREHDSAPQTLYKEAQPVYWAPPHEQLPIMGLRVTTIHMTDSLKVNQALMHR